MIQNKIYHLIKSNRPNMKLLTNKKKNKKDRSKLLNSQQINLLKNNIYLSVNLSKKAQKIRKCKLPKINMKKIFLLINNKFLNSRRRKISGLRKLNFYLL